MMNNIWKSKVTHLFIIPITRVSIALKAGNYLYVPTYQPTDLPTYQHLTVEMLQTGISVLTTAEHTTGSGLSVKAAKFLEEIGAQ